VSGLTMESVDTTGDKWPRRRACRPMRFTPKAR
jgi:hypothetical protein